METTAKITSVQENQRSYQGKFGTTYIHFVKYEGDPADRAWEYHCLKQQCEKFKEGQVAKFETQEVKSQDGKYTNYKIKPVVDQGNGYAGKKAEPKDSGIITYLSCFSSSANYYAQRESTPEKVLELAERAFQEAIKHSTLK